MITYINQLVIILSSLIFEEQKYFLTQRML